jgi:UDP-glucose 4-epimerase
MKVAVVGASGNLGTALLRHLHAEVPDWTLVGVCRRPPTDGETAYERVTWVSADIADPLSADVLVEAFTGVDAVVHLAWAIQPNRDERQISATNVDGSGRVFAAARTAGVPHLVHGSSVGAYSPGPKDRPVDESWPTDGIPTSHYARHKAAVEHDLDELEGSPGAPLVARVRPGLIFHRDAGSQVARYFLGPLVPTTVLGLRRLPVLPLPDEFVFQAVHGDDVADAYLRILQRRATGAFNVAAEPVLDRDRLAEVFHARPVRVPVSVVRRVAALTWKARLQPSDPGWVDMGAAAPVMSIERAKRELGWSARHDSRAAVAELLSGMGRGSGTSAPVMAPRRGWPWRTRRRGGARA